MNLISFKADQDLVRELRRELNNIIIIYEDGLLFNDKVFFGVIYK